MQTESISTDATRQYWIRVDTYTAVAEDIRVQLHGADVVGLDKLEATNLHLGAGENVFTFTLSAAQISAWNNNTNSSPPSFAGFNILDSSGDSLEGAFDANQFFLGGASVHSTTNIPGDDTVGISQIDFEAAASLLPGRIITLGAGNQIGTIADPTDDIVSNTTNIGVNRSGVQNNDVHIDRNASQITALQNQINGLTPGISLHQNVSQFITATAPDNFPFASTPSTSNQFLSGSVEEWYGWSSDETFVREQQGPISYSRVYNQVSQINPFTLNIAAGHTSLPDAHPNDIWYEAVREFNTALRNHTFITRADDISVPVARTGQVLTRAAVMELTLTNADPTDHTNRDVLSIPLVVNYDSQGDASLAFYETWPVDSTFQIDHIVIRYFFYTGFPDPYTLQNYLGGTRIVRFDDSFRSGAAGTLRVVMSQVEFDAVDNAPGDVTMHFNDILGGQRRIVVNDAVTVNVTPTPNGWLYVDLTGDAIDPFLNGWLVERNSPVLLTSGGTSEITTVVANAAPNTDAQGDPITPPNLDTVGISGTTYNIPEAVQLFNRKTDLFLGIEGDSRERVFTTGDPADPEITSTVTEYITNGVSYYFVEGVRRPDLPTTAASEWSRGDGIWTTLDFEDPGDIASIREITADNTANLIG